MAVSIQNEINEGLRLLIGLEEGRMSAVEAYRIANEREPLLVFFIIKYLREKYPSSNPASEAVLGRVLELTQTYDSIATACKEGEKDILNEWFDDAHDVKEFNKRPQEYMKLIVEKIEG